MTLRISVNCPDDPAAIERIVNAAAQAGAGHIGRYSRVALILRGYETWIPEPGANPTIGHVGETTHQASVRIEMQCAERDKRAVVAAIRSNHAYEEPVIELIRLESLD